MLASYGGSSGCVTVVIPLYNHAAYIAQALESVIAQGTIVREVIVIDDGSTDTSLQEARRFSALHPRVKVTGQTNRGAAATLNRGIEVAAGEYVAILNSDDLWAPQRLEGLVRALELDRGLDLAASDISFIDGHGRKITNEWHGAALNNFITCRNLGLALIDACFLMTTSNFVVRRNVFCELGGFADLRYAHDMDFALRLAANHRRIGFVDRKLLTYRLHETNTIKENHRKVRVDWVMAASFFLWRMSRASGHTQLLEQGWQILARHSLTQAAQDCISYFDANPSTSLAGNRLLVDNKMKSKLLAVV